MAVLVERLPFVTLLLRLRGNTEIQRDALERRRTFDHKVAALISAARDEGSLRQDIDPRTVTRLLFGTINSIVEWYKPGGSLSPEKLADDVITMAFNGLHSPTDPSRSSCTLPCDPRARSPCPCARTRSTDASPARGHALPPAFPVDMSSARPRPPLGHVLRRPGRWA